MQQINMVGGYIHGGPEKKKTKKNSKLEGGRLPRTIRYIKSEYIVYDHTNSIKSWKEVSSSVLKQIICYRIARNKGYT